MLIDLPITFRLNGTYYDQVFISMNGWLEFGNPGTADFSNDCLPNSEHTGPFIAAYWDDLTGELHYGCVGSGSNNVFIVSWNATTLDGGHNVDFQVQIHEESGLINVKYFDMAPEAIGQSATIGFQMNVGLGTKVYPIVCNGTVLDDNSGDSGSDPSAEGWSIMQIK